MPRPGRLWATPLEKPPGYWKDPPTSLLPQHQVLPDLFWVEVFTVEGFFDRPRATDVQRLPHREDGAVMVREPSSLKNQRTLELSMELKPPTY